jgi:phosphatidylcholine synthase
MPPRLAGILIHSFTACGAAAGLAALFAAADGHFTAMFAWLGTALVIDAVDGSLARHFMVGETVTHIDGATLDLVVDFLTYVVVPLVALWRSQLVEPLLSVFLCCAVCAASALYFADRRMKTRDYWFRGFPAIWNVLVFYLLVLRPPEIVTVLTVIVAACLMFAPVAFVHPLRVVRLRPVTITATGVWGAGAIAALEQNLFQSGLITKTALVGAGLYFLVLPFFRGLSR